VADELARQDKVLTQRRSEITAINAKYESDKQRWRELRIDPKAPAAAAPSAPSNASPAASSTGQARSATASTTSNVAPK
jgi:hypothetical protein